MTALQYVGFGAASDGSEGDTVRTGFTKANANVDVLNTQAALTSATTITVAQALTAAHIGKRVSINLGAAGTINVPPANAGGADEVLHLRNVGTTVVTLAVAAGSGDTLALSRLNPGESALLDTDGAHTWSVLMRGRSNADNESVVGTLTVGGAISAAGAYSGTNGNYSGNVAVSGTLGVTGQATFTLRPSFAGKTPWDSGNLANPMTLDSAQTVNAAKTFSADVSVTSSGTLSPGLYLKAGSYNPHWRSNSSIPAVELVNGANSKVNLTISDSGIVSAGMGFYVSTGSNTTRVEVHGFGSGAGYGSIWQAGPSLYSSTPCVFVNPDGATAGSININTSSVSYDSASDYRIKDVVGPLESALDLIRRVAAKVYHHKPDKSKQIHFGFIAHELQQVAPYAVRGEKDAKDERGNPVLQMVDYGKLTPILWAALSEIDKRLAAVEAVKS